MNKKYYNVKGIIEALGNHLKQRIALSYCLPDYSKSTNRKARWLQKNYAFAVSRMYGEKKTEQIFLDYSDNDPIAKKTMEEISERRIKYEKEYK
ncbi:hypothetical protein [uncultured Mediterranean phage uvDeep-CGR2-KM21-C368]|nr:hypothetical protein [uncultured Mediterranean phage uvDeep-CGR2-KM21-C368]